MKPLTGRKVLVIALTAFAVILTPNLILAYYAVNTFSGLVVANSYVASQQFNERTRAQQALAWELELDYRPGEALHVAFVDAEGEPVRPHGLEVTVGRPTSARTDQTLALEASGAGWFAPLALDPGSWLVRVSAQAPDGTLWKQRHTLNVRPSS